MGLIQSRYLQKSRNFVALYIVDSLCSHVRYDNEIGNFKTITESVMSDKCCH